MTDRRLQVGDTDPPLKGLVANADGPVDLSDADAIEVILRGTVAQIVGEAQAIDPPETDGDETWNWLYPWAADDSAKADSYDTLLKVTWNAATTPPRVEYFTGARVVIEQKWSPRIQDIAELSPAYTRTLIEQGGLKRHTFDETTDPTADEVQGYIDAAVGEVLSRVGVGELPDRVFDLARTTAAWHAAATVESEKVREGVSEAEGDRSWKASSYVACLKELSTQARSGGLRLNETWQRDT